MQFEHKNWDTEFFGFKVAELIGTCGYIMLHELLDELRKKDYRLVYWSVDIDDFESNDAADKMHLFLADTRVVFTKTMQMKEDSEMQFAIETYNGPVNDDLISLALQSGAYSRFKNDERLPTGTFEKLYTIWMINAIEKKYVKEIFVLKEEEKIIAFLSVNEINNKRAEIDQVAVDKYYRGKKIGAQLVFAAEQWAKKNDYSEIQVATQKRNVEACKFYEACNFQIEYEKNLYHIWL